MYGFPNIRAARGLAMQLLPVDAIHLSFVCKSARHMFLESPTMLVAVHVARSRLLVEPWGSIPDWARVWELCAEAVEEKGWDVSAWAYAMMFVEVDEKPDDWDDDLDGECSLPQVWDIALPREVLTDICKHVARRVGPQGPEVVAILALTGSAIPETTWISSILLLANGQFASLWHHCVRNT